MARSPDRRIARVLACCLLASACEVASAAPAPDRKAEREAKKAAREAKKAAREASSAAAKPPASPPASPPAAAPKPPTSRPADTAKAPATPSPTAAPNTAAKSALPACPADNALTFRSFGAGFLRTWCTGCHSSSLAEADRQDAPGDVNFEAHALYLPHAQEVFARVVVEGRALAADPAASASPMPPAGLVPDAELRRLAQWIACGSPQ